MTIETIFGLIGSGLSLAGITASYLVSIRKAKKEIEITKEKEAAEISARKKAEKQKFYLTVAANLVVSAEKLKLSGPQKKEYVMTWLENEAVKAGIQVDKALMSVAIERTILILNDFKDPLTSVSDLLAVELDLAVEEEQAKIEAQTNKALKELQIRTAQNHDQVAKAVNLSKTTVNDVKSILNKKH
jgi:hypothetical protein